jgi:hypothetical protein
MTLRRYPGAKKQGLNMSSYVMIVASTGGVPPESCP